MQIDFASSGGFASLRLNYRADTNKLPEEQAQALTRLIESSGVLDLEQEDVNANMTVGRADVISYRLTLLDGAGQKTLWFNDVTAPASVRPLLAYLRKLALEQKRKGARPSWQTHRGLRNQVSCIALTNFLSFFTIHFIQRVFND